MVQKSEQRNQTLSRQPESQQCVLLGLNWIRPINRSKVYTCQAQSSSSVMELKMPDLRTIVDTFICNPLEEPIDSGWNWTLCMFFVSWRRPIIAPFSSNIFGSNVFFFEGVINNELYLT